MRRRQHNHYVNERVESDTDSAEQHGLWDNRLRYADELGEESEKEQRSLDVQGFDDDPFSAARDADQRCKSTD
jgi:hypothetical protein